MQDVGCSSLTQQVFPRHTQLDLTQVSLWKDLYFRDYGNGKLPNCGGAHPVCTESWKDYYKTTKVYLPCKLLDVLSDHTDEVRNWLGLLSSLCVCVCVLLVLGALTLPSLFFSPPPSSSSSLFQYQCSIHFPPSLASSPVIWR